MENVDPHALRAAVAAAALELARLSALVPESGIGSVGGDMERLVATLRDSNATGGGGGLGSPAGLQRHRSAAGLGEADDSFWERRTWTGKAKKTSGAAEVFAEAPKQAREGQLAEGLGRGKAGERSGTGHDSFHLSGSMQTLLAATKKMNWPKEASAAERAARAAKDPTVWRPRTNKLLDHPLYKARRKADGYTDRSAFTNLDDVINCTFVPKVRQWSEGASKKSGRNDDDEGEAKEQDDVMAQFVKRSDAWNRKVTADREAEIGKRAYEALLTRKVCPDCVQADGKRVYQVKRLGPARSEGHAPRRVASRASSHPSAPFAPPALPGC